MEAFVAALTIFVLALFVGFEIITKVPPLLHTPLMSGANAISGITLVGTLVTSGARLTLVTEILGFTFTKSVTGSSLPNASLIQKVKTVSFSTMWTFERGKPT